MALASFESHGGRLEAFDDGHCPETFRFQQPQGRDGENGDEEIATPRIVRYDSQQATSTSSSQSSLSSNVHIYDNVLNPNHTHMLYKATSPSKHAQQAMNQSGDDDKIGSPTKLEGESPWGTYVTIKEALEWIEWNKRESRTEQCDHGTFEEYLVAWRLKMNQFYNWKNHTRKSLEEKKEEQLELDSAKEGNIHNNLRDDMDNVRHALAVEAVAKFFIQTVPSEPGTTEVATAHTEQSSREALFQTSHIIKQAHGVAVWALSSNPGHSVQYHMDYAELLRYEYNVTVPPLWAGTIQCSALWNGPRPSNDDKQSSSNDLQPQSNCVQNHMKGGEFCVNLRGLEHYREHGYKGNLSGDPTGGWSTLGDDVAGRCLKGGVHLNDDTQWVTIPYAFNRGIVHEGDLPHLSAPIECIGARDKSSLEKEHNSQSQNISRVIVGFNVFGHDVGALIAKAPEHSKPFRRKVKLYRSTMNASAKEKKGAGGKSCRGGMDLSQIRKNKGLTKLLVLAKREKVKEELRRNQEQLSCGIRRRLLSRHEQDQPLLRIADFVEEFGRPNDNLDGVWPKSVDVHVHLHHMLMSTNNSTQGMAQEQRCPMSNLFQDTNGIAGCPGVWYHMQTISRASSSNTGNSNCKSSDGGLIPLVTEIDIAEVE